ncbi:MAG: ChbG/HpnK family deacetylase [Candidatus Riflebacteria bacterium]|nr:ChbG/HpnK family deacetylase [Candidatus Riflebacteria bacterium]
MPQRLLFITADDFGMDPGIDDGILEGIQAGGIGNVSIWTAYPHLNAIPEAIRSVLTRACTGIHWSLFPPEIDINRPLDWASALSLAFPDRRRMDAERTTWDAAFDALDRQGVRPAFINGHQHVHLFPGWVKAVCSWAVMRGITVMRRPVEVGSGGFFAKVRRPALMVLESLGSLAVRLARRFPLIWVPTLCRWGRSFTFEAVFDGLSETSPDIKIELMTHPGRPSDRYLRETRSPSDHLGQLTQVCRHDLPAIIARHGFRLARLDGRPLNNG